MRISRGKPRGHRAQAVACAVSDPTLAVLLCRVSSKKQAEGYSLAFQERNGRLYAAKRGLTLSREPFKITETASKKEQREEFADFLRYVETHPERHILIPKVDRCLRNFDDLALIAKFPTTHGKTLHFFDDGLELHKDSPPADLLRLGIQGTVATWYSADLAAKVTRGMDEKARQGGWGCQAPFGYMNVPGGKIEPDPAEAPWLIRIKGLAASKEYSIDRIIARLRTEGCSLKMTRNLVERIIRNPFAAGRFVWKGELHEGSYKPLVSWSQHEAAVAGLARLGKSKFRPHSWPYSGLVECARCGSTVIWEGHEKKSGRRYVYGCCTAARRGECDNVYLPEAEFEHQFAAALRAVELTPEVIEVIMADAATDAGKETMARETQLATLRAELARLKTMIDAAYEDKVGGKIPESFWLTKTRKWQEQQIRLEESITRLATTGPTTYLGRVRRVLELTKDLEKKFFSLEPSKRSELLRTVCLNFRQDGKSIAPVYRKPFDILARMGPCPKWWAL